MEMSNAIVNNIL